MKKHIFFHEGRLFLDRDSFPSETPAPLYEGVERSEKFVFPIGGCEYEAYDLGKESSATLSEGEWMELRASASVLSADDYRAAAKGAELLHWNRSSRWCGKCGSRLVRSSEISKKCVDCGQEYFPSLSPCAIVLVEKGEEALLVHASNFKRHFFGLVAGFVETGESLEECVAREVMEETGLEIGDIRYFGSQSWPFPAQLMVGFTARWKSGGIRFADGELTEGGFFSRSNLPELPSPPSIARKMIDAWVSRGQV